MTASAELPVSVPAEPPVSVPAELSVSAPAEPPVSGSVAAEPSTFARERTSPFGAAWRAAVARAQEQALPSGEAVVSCAASPGVAGLGRHVKEILDAFARGGQPSVCVSPAMTERVAVGPSLVVRVSRRAVARGRRSSAGRARQMWAEFDADVAGRLPEGDHLMAFCGQALAQFGAARRMGYQSVALVSGGVHERRLARQHAAAHRRYPLERSNAGRVSERHLLEYAQAERIYVASRYVWESFVEEGVPEDVLARFPLTPDPRFAPDGAPRRSATFDIVYVGGLSVAKGVPLLIDVVRRLRHEDMRLVLVGGWKSRGMRRFVEQACAEDRRIKAAPGDPLPHLRGARLCVHPSYVDGFSYGAAEALACGVPVVASEDTGMKELIEPGRTGLVVPTGDPAALTEAIDAAYRGEILGK
jgi:glycosyltransferase involved in cell wall biosynthesis